MILRLYFDSTVEPLTSPVNEGITTALALLNQAESNGIQCERIDTSKLSESERTDAYFQAVAPSVLKKYRIRQVFGSRRNSGWLFGKGVPALTVTQPGNKYPDDVYPRNERGRIVTIKHFLEESLRRARTMCKFCRHHTSVHTDTGCQADMCICRQPYGEPSIPIASRTNEPSTNPSLTVGPEVAQA